MSWLDLLPSSEKRRIRKKMRSPEVYEKTREKVKGPEELEDELKVRESLADIKFGIETSSEKYSELKEKMDASISESGIENIVDINDTSKESVKALEEGLYEIQIESDNSNNPEQIVLLPEGNVSEKIPLQKSISEKFI